MLEGLVLSRLKQDGTGTGDNGENRQRGANDGPVVDTGVAGHGSARRLGTAGARAASASDGVDTRRTRGGSTSRHGRARHARHTRHAGSHARPRSHRHRTGHRGPRRTAGSGERLNTVTDRRVRLAVGSGGGRSGSRGRDGLADGECAKGSALGVGTGVALSKGRVLPVAQGVDTGRVGRVTVALGKRVVSVVAGHDELTAHEIERVLALDSGGIGRVFGDTDTETELVVRHVAVYQYRYVGDHDAVVSGKV